MPLTYSLGRGGPWTYPQSVAVGPGGDIWVGGVATGNTLPVVNAYQQQYSPALCGQFLSCPDLFVSRLRSDGQGALFSTYLGGSGGDNLAGMAVDGQGNAYLTGTTSSDTFPFNRDLTQQGDFAFRSFVVKMSPSGGLVYAAPLPGNTFPAAIVVDQQGAAYVGGTTVGEVGQIGGLGLEPGIASLMRTDDSGQTWVFRNRGVTNDAFFYNSELLAVSQGAAVRLYANGFQFLFRSDDRGESWEPIGPRDDLPNPTIQDVEVEPHQPGRVWLAQSCGVYTTSDGGETWVQSIDPPKGVSCIFRVAIAASRPEVVFAAGYNGTEPLVVRSSDGGATWATVAISVNEPVNTVTGLAVDPSEPDRVYAVFNGPQGSALFRSDDAAKNWRRLFDLTELVPVIDPVQPEALYMITRHPSTGARRVYRSSDRGETWLSSEVPQGPDADGDYLLNLAIGSGVLYVTSTQGHVFSSMDQGQTWSVAPGPPVPVFQVAADPVQPATIYALGNTHLEQGFLLKLDPDASRIEYFTLLGGAAADAVSDLEVDGEGRVYATGRTSSPDFPVTAQLTSNRPGFEEDTFLAVVNPGGDVLEYSSLIGGSSDDGPFQIALGRDGAVVLAGPTLSRDLPLEKPIATSPGELSGYWIALLEPGENRFRFAGYLGQNELYGPALAAGPDGSIYVSGIRRVVDQNGFGNEASFLLRLDDEGSVLQDDAIVAGAIAARSPGSIVVAAVGFSGIVNSAFSQQQQQHIETPAVLVSVVDYEAGVPDGPRLFGMVNAADQRTHPLTPATVVSIYGTNLGPPSGVAGKPGDGRFPTALAGVRVFFGDRPAPLLYVSEGQINTVTPGDLRDHPLVPIRVERNGVSSNLLTMTTDSLSPGMFITGPGAGPGAEPFVLAINADGTLNSPANPAQRGTAVSIFATGIGTYAPLLADGEIAPLEPPYPAAPDVAGVEVEFLPAQVTYAGAAPGVVTGVAQINFVIPPDGPFGNRYLYLKTPNGSAYGLVRLAIRP